MNTYKITYENGREFTYAQLSAEQKVYLRNIQPEASFVSEATVSFIRGLLNVERLSDDELTYVRNSVVHFFAEIAELSRTEAELESKKGLKAKELMKEGYDAMTRMSMVTAVIDHEKWNRGLAV